LNTTPNAGSEITRRASDTRERAELLASTLPPLLIEAERVASTVAQGVHGRRRVGLGETFWQFRRYRPGDPASRIDWRRSAKSHRTYVRETEWEAAQSVWLWRDASPSMRYRSSSSLDTKVDRATLLLLASASLLMLGGEHVALLGYDRIARAGRATLAEMTVNLTREETRSDLTSLPPTARLPRHAQVVLVSDFLAPFEETERLVKRFAAGGVSGHLLQVLDPAEEELPFSGRTRFEGLEAEGDLTVGRAESLRDDYRARLAALRESLADLTRRIGWTLTLHRTDHTPQQGLLPLYASFGSVSS
jgi:uncharacterized protein (DUF58 family)